MSALAFVVFVWVAFLGGCAVMVALDNRAARRERDQELLAFLDAEPYREHADQAIALTDPIPVIDHAELKALATTADLPEGFRC